MDTRTAALMLLPGEQVPDVLTPSVSPSVISAICTLKDSFLWRSPWRQCTPQPYTYVEQTPELKFSESPLTNFSLSTSERSIFYCLEILDHI